jgi:peptide-methionine (R)-S-oxide reductase
VDAIADASQRNAVTTARALATGRIAFGVSALLLPRLLGRLFLGRVVDAPGGSAAVRTVGVRDLALGAGLLLADRRGRPVRGWLEAGVLVDALDAMVALFAGRGVPFLSRVFVVLVGTGAAVAGAVAANGLAEHRPQESVDLPADLD